MKLILTLVVLLWSTFAVAHDWYPIECCSEYDCEPVSSSKIKATAEGWLLPNGDTVPYDKTRISPDENFHVCTYANGQTRKNAGTYCVWAPPQSF